MRRRAVGRERQDPCPVRDSHLRQLGLVSRKQRRNVGRGRGYVIR